MDTFSKKEMNYALLGMYVGTRGPKALRKCITDQLFTYQMYRHEETIRKKLDAEMVLLAFPPGQNLLFLDDLDDLLVPEIGLLAFGLSTDRQDSSKLRKSIQDILEGRTFPEYLKSKEKKFRTSKLLSKTQLAKIYPDGIDVNINDLDITVLCFILFEGMGYRPISDFDKLPSDSVITEADDMLRIKMCRNILVHQPVAEISDEDFETYWECLTGAFERLLKSPRVRQESERLKALRLSEEKIEQFKVMLQDWRMDEQDNQRKHLDQIKDIVSKSGLHTCTECIIKATGTQIVENQNKNHQELVTLFKKGRKAHNKELKRSFPLRVYGYEKFKEICDIMHEKRIKFSIPTASSSTDTPPNSDRPSSPEISDPGIEQFQKQNEDAVHNMCTNLPRRGDCNTTNNKTSSTNIETDTSKPFHGGSLTDVSSETNPEDADDEDEGAYEYSTLQSNTSEVTERQTSLRSSQCLDNGEPRAQLTIKSKNRKRRGYVFNRKDEQELLRVLSGRSCDNEIDIDCYKDLVSAKWKKANISQQQELHTFEQGQGISKYTLELEQSSGITGGEDNVIDLLPHENDAPDETGSAWSLCSKDLHQAQHIELSNYNEATYLPEDQWTFRAQITLESKNRQRRGYAFNAKDMEEFYRIMPEVPYAGMSLYCGLSSKSDSYYTSGEELSSMENANKTQEEVYSDLVPDTGIPVYMWGNSESSGYYSSALAASSSLYGTTGRDASELYAYVDTAQLPRTEYSSYSAGFSNNPGNAVDFRRCHLISLDEAREREEKGSCDLKTCQEDAIRSVTMMTASSDKDIEQKDNRHRHKPKLRRLSRLFLTCIPFRDRDTSEPVTDARNHPNKRTTSVQRQNDRGKIRTNNEASHYAELLPEEPYEHVGE